MGGTPQKGYFDAENDDKTTQFRNPFVACLTAEVAGDISHKWDIIKDTLSFLKAHGANMCSIPVENCRGCTVVPTVFWTQGFECFCEFVC